MSHQTFFIPPTPHPFLRFFFFATVSFFSGYTYSWIKHKNASRMPTSFIPDIHLRSNGLISKDYQLMIKGAVIITAIYIGVYFSTIAIKNIYKNVHEYIIEFNRKRKERREWTPIFYEKLK